MIFVLCKNFLSFVRITQNQKQNQTFARICDDIDGKRCCAPRNWIECHFATNDLICIFPIFCSSVRSHWRCLCWLWTVLLFFSPPFPFFEPKISWISFSKHCRNCRLYVCECIYACENMVSNLKHIWLDHCDDDCLGREIERAGAHKKYRTKQSTHEWVSEWEKESCSRNVCHDSTVHESLNIKQISPVRFAHYTFIFAHTLHYTYNTYKHIQFGVLCADAERAQ